MKRKTGQHFLVDPEVAKREVEYADVQKDDVVLEVGSGTGVLTRILSEKAKKVVSIEVDSRLVEKLKTDLPSNVILIHNDVLKVDLESYSRFNKIVSNLPFQISSPITFKFLDYDFDLAVLIYQKEFADRMVAKPGSKHYSRLSIGVYYKAYCEILEIVPKSCFFPQPKVFSCMVKLVPKKTPPFVVADEKFFFDITRELFNHRRKKIKNILMTAYEIKSFEDIPYTDKRVEQLIPEQIGELSSALFNNLQTK